MDAILRWVPNKKEAQQTDTQQTEAQEMEAQEMEALRPYFVAPDLQLPKTPYLLILRHAREKNGTPDAIEDVAGNYFRSVHNTEVWPPITYLTSEDTGSTAEYGWHMAAAKMHASAAISPPHGEPSNHRWFTAYPPDAFATLPMTQRLIFNKIRNAEKDTGDWIELKNISETAVPLRDWHISIVASTGKFADEDIGIVWFPDWTLPVNGVLLITNTEPDETVMVDGRNITPGCKSAARGAASVSRGTELETARDTVSADFAARAREKTAPLMRLRMWRVIISESETFRIQPTGSWHRHRIRVRRQPPLSQTGTWQRKDVRHRGSLATAWDGDRIATGVSDPPP